MRCTSLVGGNGPLPDHDDAFQSSPLTSYEDLTLVFDRPLMPRSTLPHGRTVRDAFDFSFASYLRAWHVAGLWQGEETMADASPVCLIASAQLPSGER